MNAHTPQPLPKFAVWLFQRRLKHEDARLALRCSREHIRLICLPFGDEARRNPSQKLRQKIASWTGGEIGLNDWSEPAQQVAA